MNNKVVIAILLLIGLLIGGSVFVFLQTFEYKEKTIHTGFLGEARVNPLYASRLFLKRMGIPAQTHKNIQGFNGLPDTNTVILINSRRTSISSRQNSELINWVKSGGHLIALTTHNWSYYSTAEDDDEYEEIKQTEISNDPLQSYLGVNTDNKVTYNDLTSLEQDRVDEIEEKDGDFVRETLFKIRLKDIDKEFAIMNSWFNPIISDSADNNFAKDTELIKIRSDNFILRQPLGNGLVTLVSSLEFIENKYLDRADHAELLWYLIHGLHSSIKQPKAVWLIHNDKISPLWSILWRNAWMFVLSLGLLLLAWFLLKTRRFGPVIPKLADNRRSLNEHISSSGNFYWQHNKKTQLLASSRATLNQELEKAYPNWQHLNKQEQLKLLHDKFNIQIQSFEKALFAETVEQADGFTKMIQLIEHIRKSLKTN